MSTVALGWIAVIVYFVITGYFAVHNARRTKSVATYAVGNRDIPAVVVGLSLAAQLTSVATFVVNPGLVYAYGYAALLGYGLCAGMGITIGLAFFSRRFRTHGARVQALTVPQWIGTRYDSKPLRAGFAVLSLGLVTFATLIVVALSVVLGRLLAVPPHWVAVGLVTIVVLGVMMGGATGHAWTNAVQASIMVVVAILLIGEGLPLLGGGGITARLAAMDPNLVGATNPASPFFRTFFEVVICNFVIGLAIVCQPHIIAKALYLREDRDVRTYLTTAIVVGLLFTGVLVAGIWARFVLQQPVPIDRVISTWIGVSFPAAVQVLITVGLLCAGLSTLEGILLALSATFSADFYPLIAGKGGDQTALRVGRAGLAVVAVVTMGLATWQLSHPTGGTVAIFAQYGVYLLFSASFLPLACGMFLPRVSRGVVTGAVVAVVVTYFAVSVFKVTMLHNNPAFLATAGILAGWVVVGAGSLLGGLADRTSPSRT